jgi:hypothetical protein
VRGWLPGLHRGDSGAHSQDGRAYCKGGDQLTIELSEDELMTLLQAMYHYREEYRLGGDELDTLCKLKKALGATDEECAKEHA